MTGNVQLYLTGVGRVLHRMEARLAGDGGWVKGGTGVFESPAKSPTVPSTFLGHLPSDEVLGPHLLKKPI